MDGKKCQDALQQYRVLEKELIEVRRRNEGIESERENPILDEMEVVWHQLSGEKQQLLYAEGTRSFMR